jgi:squalene cyclase
VDDAASALLVLSWSNVEDRSCIDSAIELLKRAQNPDGGYGPFAHSPSEPFDSAVALIALNRFRDRKETRQNREHAREFLIKNQKADGSWTETTRPAGAESYAQRISTTSWATMALLSP